MIIAVHSIQNRRSYTILELILILVLILILLTFAKNVLGDEKQSLFLARDYLINQIRYTQSIALKDDKFSTVAQDSSAKEETINKSFFRQRWQLRVRDDRGDNPYIYLEIYSNSPKGSVFNIYSDKTDTHNEFLNDTLTQDSLTGNLKINSLNSMNLTDYFGITRVEINNTKYDTNMHNNFGDGFRLLFDEVGRPYFAEDSTSTTCTNDPLSSEFNPFDLCRRKPLEETLEIKLFKDNESACFRIEPLTGYIYDSDCI